MTDLGPPGHDQADHDRLVASMGLCTVCAAQAADQRAHGLAGAPTVGLAHPTQRSLLFEPSASPGSGEPGDGCRPGE